MQLDGLCLPPSIEKHGSKHELGPPFGRGFASNFRRKTCDQRLYEVLPEKRCRWLCPAYKCRLRADLASIDFRYGFA